MFFLKTKPRFGTLESYLQSLLYSTEDYMTIPDIQETIKSSIFIGTYPEIEDNFLELMRVLNKMAKKKWIKMYKGPGHFEFYYYYE